MTHYGNLKRLIFAIPSLMPKEVVLAIEELERRIEELEEDRAFYKSCALSGEVPKDGDEPSARKEGK